MRAVSRMTEDPAPIPADQAGYLILVAARAPSVHNTQPWRFKVSEYAIELYADLGRQLRTDPDGREMLISCGAALYGLRLGVRSLGHRPMVELLPGSGATPGAQRSGSPAQRLLARVRLGPASPMTADERRMLLAVPHRHTHRGPFEPGPLPEGLITSLRGHAQAEGATLAVMDTDHAYSRLLAVVDRSSRARALDLLSRTVTELWTRDASSEARDGVPAHAFPAAPGRGPGGLPQRDFDLGRGLGLLADGGPNPPVTAVLFTAGDGERDWLRAGQALHRLLLHAASQWAFARLDTEPLEESATRQLIKESLALPGEPQMLVQLGVARTTRPTARRTVAELTEP
jgi:hypothetical protein